MLRTSGYRKNRSDEIADVSARFETGQKIVSPKPAVGISDAEIKEDFRLIEEENNKEERIKAKGCRVAANVYIEEELMNEWAARLLQFSGQYAKLLVSLIIGYTEVNYHR